MRDGATGVQELHDQVAVLLAPCARRGGHLEEAEAVQLVMRPLLDALKYIHAQVRR